MNKTLATLLSFKITKSCTPMYNDLFLLHFSISIILGVLQVFKVSVYPKFDHFSKKCFSLFQIDRIAIFHLKKKFYEKRLILSKVINEKRFFPLIISNG